MVVNLMLFKVHCTQPPHTHSPNWPNCLLHSHPDVPDRLFARSDTMHVCVGVDLHLFHYIYVTDCQCI